MKTKKILLETVRHLLENKNIEEITVQDILDSSGVSRATFYHYFRDKYDLVNQYYIDHVSIDFLSRYDGTNYYEITRKTLDFIFENRRYFKNIYSCDNFNTVFESHCDHCRNAYIETYKNAFPEKEITSELLFKIECVSRFRADIVRKWVLENCSVPIEEIIYCLQDLLPDIYSLDEHLHND